MILTYVSSDDDIREWFRVIQRNDLNEVLSPMRSIAHTNDNYHADVELVTNEVFRSLTSAISKAFNLPISESRTVDNIYDVVTSIAEGVVNSPMWTRLSLNIDRTDR